MPTFLCPECGQPLRAVTQPSNSPLNRDQWESTIAGNYYCICHNNHRGDRPYAYFWRSELKFEACPRCYEQGPATIMCQDPWHAEAFLKFASVKERRAYFAGFVRGQEAGLKIATDILNTQPPPIYVIARANVEENT